MAQTASAQQLLLLITPFLFLLFHPSPTNSQSTLPPLVEVIDILTTENSGQYDIFFALIQEAEADPGFSSQVTTAKGLTVFAPPDTAFQKLPPGTLQSMSCEQRVHLVETHIVPIYYTWQDLEIHEGTPVATLASHESLTFDFGDATNVKIRTSGNAKATITGTLSSDDTVGVYRIDGLLYTHSRH